MYIEETIDIGQRGELRYVLSCNQKVPGSTLALSLAFPIEKNAISLIYIVVLLFMLWQVNYKSW